MDQFHQIMHGAAPDTAQPSPGLKKPAKSFEIKYLNCIFDLFFNLLY